jgi:hypothetical protein
MRRFLNIAALVMLVAVISTPVHATTATMISVAGSTATNTVATGWIDKIEIVGDANVTGTYTCVVATYSAAGSAVDTLASASITANSAVVVRPRAVGTTSAGVALTAVAGTGTNTLTVLSAPYDRILAGGNMLMKCTSGTGGVVTATIYFVPVAK